MTNNTLTENTVILTENEGAINSKDFWGYAIERVLHTDPNETVDADDSIIYRYQIVACQKYQEMNVVICNLENRQIALAALDSLLQAIGNSDRIWDSQEHMTAC